MLDYEDFKVLSIALEDINPPPKRSIESLSTDNNSNASPSSLANILVDPEFACLL